MLFKTSKTNTPYFTPRYLVTARMRLEPHSARFLRASHFAKRLRTGA
jgi:hypothetical protein